MAGRQLVLFRQDVQTDESLALLLDRGKLPMEAEGEVLQPLRQIQISPADALDRAVIAEPVPIVVFAEGEQPLEAVALAIETKHGKEGRRSPVAIQKWMNVR